MAKSYLVIRSVNRLGSGQLHIGLCEMRRFFNVEAAEEAATFVTTYIITALACPSHNFS